MGMPRAISWCIPGVWVLTLLFCGGCASVSVDSATKGRSGYRFVAPGPSLSPPTTIEAMPTGVRMDVVEPPEPIEPLTKPVYPPSALAGRAGVVTVGVRITIDETGRVTDIGESVWALSTPTAWDKEFRAAVDAAVATWRFAPAQRQQVKRVKPRIGPDFVRIERSEAMPWTYDVSFTFSASGDVVSQLFRRP